MNGVFYLFFLDRNLSVGLDMLEQFLNRSLPLSALFLFQVMKGAGTRRRNRTSANSVSLHRRGKEGKQKIPRAEHNEEKTRVMKER